MIHSAQRDPEDNAFWAIRLIEKVRQDERFKDALLVIAPESNLCGYASGLLKSFVRNKVQNFIMVNLDYGGQMPGVRTNNHNKLEFGNCARVMARNEEIKVWKRFISVGNSSKVGDRSLWRKFVDECSHMMLEIKMPKEASCEPSFKLAGKIVHRTDDLVMTFILFCLIQRVWAINSQYLTAENNVFNHSRRHRTAPIQPDLVQKFLMSYSMKNAGYQAAMETFQQ